MAKIEQPISQVLGKPFQPYIYLVNFLIYSVRYLVPRQQHEPRLLFSSFQIIIKKTHHNSTNIKARKKLSSDSDAKSFGNFLCIFHKFGKVTFLFYKFGKRFQFTNRLFHGQTAVDRANPGSSFQP